MAGADDGRRAGSNRLAVGQRPSSGVEVSERRPACFVALVGKDAAPATGSCEQRRSTGGYNHPTEDDGDDDDDDDDDDSDSKWETNAGEQPETDGQRASRQTAAQAAATNVCALRIVAFIFFEMAA